MIDIRPYMQGDALLVEPLPIFSPIEFIQVRLDIFAMNPNSFSRTITVDGRPIGIIGMTFNWQGMADVWALLSEEVLKYPFFLHKKAKYYLDLYQKIMNVHRYEANIRCGFEAGFRWAERLGFQAEGLMRKWGPEGHDYMKYGRVA